MIRGIFVDKQNAAYDSIEKLFILKDFDVKSILKNARQTVLSNYVEETYLRNMKNVMACIIYNRGGDSKITITLYVSSEEELMYA